MRIWYKFEGKEYKQKLCMSKFPNGLYYKGKPILLIYDSDLFLNIMAFLELIEYYYAYPQDIGREDMENFKFHIHKRLYIAELKEYIYSPNGEERTEISNTCNHTRFPIVWTWENELRIYIPNKKEEWKLQKYIRENPHFFLLLFQNLQDWTHFIHRKLEIQWEEKERICDGDKFITNEEYIYQFEFKWLYFSPNTLLKFSQSLLKIIALNDWDWGKRDVRYSYQLLNPFSYHIYSNYISNLSYGEKLGVFSLRIFCGIWEINKKWEDIFDYYMEEYMAKFSLLEDFVVGYLHIKKYIEKNIPLLYRIIDSLPFTAILYMKYNLGISSISFLLKYYLGFRLIKIFLRWLFIIWKSFYPRIINGEEEKIFNRYIFPLLTIANLQILGLCFLLLNKYIPHFQYLGLILFIILRYIIMEKLNIWGNIIENI